MIDILNAADVRQLHDQRGEDLISIYIPTEKAGGAIQRNPIRLKNQLQAVEAELEERGLAHEHVRRRLQSAYDLCGDREFWRRQSQGLALFIQPEGETDLFRLPVRFESLTRIAHRFHTKRMLPALAGDERFYVLALSQDGVRLLSGSRFQVEQVQIPDGLPDSLEEMLAAQDVVAWRQARFRAAGRISGPSSDTAASTERGGGCSLHSVSYVVEEDEKQRILEFFRRVDEGVCQILHGKREPLVLAGVEYLLPLYEEANTYVSLLTEDYVTGNPEELSAEELHDAAWGIVEPIFERRRAKLAEDFHAMQPRDQATVDLEEAVRAAHYGRVDTLWVRRGECVWGLFDSDTGQTTVEEEPRIDNYDLLDDAALSVLENSGRVYVVTEEEMPADSAIAALLRH